MVRISCIFTICWWQLVTLLTLRIFSSITIINSWNSTLFILKNLSCKQNEAALVDFENEGQGRQWWGWGGIQRLRYQSTRILRFGKLEAEGGLRKIITYQTQRHQHCRKEETERQPHQRLDRALPKHVELWCGACVNVEGKTFGEATDAQ